MILKDEPDVTTCLYKQIIKSFFLALEIAHGLDELLVLVC